jgi:hypothetical protein
MHRKVKYLHVFQVIACELHQEQYRFGNPAEAPSWAIRDINTAALVWALLVLKCTPQLDIEFS